MKGRWDIHGELEKARRWAGAICRVRELVLVGGKESWQSSGLEHDDLGVDRGPCKLAMHAVGSFGLVLLACYCCWASKMGFKIAKEGLN